MAYSRIKIWIAAEVLTAANLNTEFSGCITNENDLGTKVANEITDRQTLETEHDALAANVWDGDHIAANTVTNASMADNAVDTAEVVDSAITGAKVAAAIKDPATDVAGFRTLGTGVVQAKPGNWAPAADSLGLEQIQYGTVMLPFYDSVEGTEHSSNTHSYTTLMTLRIYVPSDAQSLKMASRQKATTGGSCYVKFLVGGTSSSESNTASTTYEWKIWAGLDVTAKFGWYDLVVQLKTTSTGHTAYLQGYSFIWE